MTKATLLKDLAKKDIHLFNNNVEDVYDFWQTPDVIVSDGAYGVSGFKGDTNTHDKLQEWYEPHIIEWTKKSRPGTTLWFWNTEVGFASVHPLLEKMGWEYLSCNIWNKGIQHIAGNCNLKVLKSFPVVTEVCIQYVKRPKFELFDEAVNLKEWLRFEWSRTGLSLYQANKACGIANAASRKYLTKDHLWYPPPAAHFDKMVKYANMNGIVSGRPYFSVDSKTPLLRKEYEGLFPIFNGKYGITNVWNVPPLHTKERIKINGSKKYFHLNQKPVKLIEMLIETSSQENSVIWEPFGGLMTIALSAYLLNRKAFAAEINESIFTKALSRFEGINFSEKVLEKLYGE